jgi:ribosomal protein S18 acetylase RimI-like enzyme
MRVFNVEHHGSVDWEYENDSSNGRNVLIDNLLVDPAHRRQGHATAIVSALLEQLGRDGVVWVSLWTGRAMMEEGSYMLYVKLGFHAAAYLPDYYAPGTGVFLYVKRLNE